GTSRHVQPAPESIASPLPPVRSAGALAAEGLVVLDGAALQRQGAAGEDAAAGRGLGGAPVLAGNELAVAALGAVVLHRDAAEEQRALVVDAPALRRRPAAKGQAPLQRQVGQRQRPGGSHVEQAEGWDPVLRTPGDGVAVAGEG